MRRLLMLWVACVLAASTAAEARTRLLVYTALENEQLEPFKQAVEAALKDVEIAWVRNSTGVITARLMAEKDNPRADVIWGLAVYSLLQLQDQGMLEPYTPAGADKLKPTFRASKQPRHGPAWTPSFRRSASTLWSPSRPTCRTIHVGRPVEPGVQGSDRHAESELLGHRVPDRRGLDRDDGRGAAWKYMTKLNENVKCISTPVRRPVPMRRAANTAWASRSTCAASRRRTRARRSR